MKPLAVFKIAAGQLGSPIILDVGRNDMLFPDRVFPSVQVAIDALHEFAKEKGWVLMSTAASGERTQTFEAYPAPMPISVKFEMQATVEFEHLLNELAVEMNASPGEAILKGLALLQIALEARREGKRLVVVDDRNNSEEEIDEV